MGAAIASRSPRVVAFACAALMGVPLVAPAGEAKMADSPNSPLAPFGVSVAQTVESALVAVSLVTEAQILPGDSWHATIAVNTTDPTGRPLVGYTTQASGSFGVPTQGNDGPTCSSDDVAGLHVMNAYSCTVRIENNKDDRYRFFIEPGFAGRVTLTLDDPEGKVRATYTCESPDRAAATVGLVTQHYGYYCSSTDTYQGFGKFPRLTFHLRLEGSGHAWGGISAS